jgi:cytochrome c oxidase subunit 4
MKAIKVNIYEACILCVTVIAMVVYASCLRDGHDWGDDFGLYLQVASNLRNGMPYDHLVNGVLPNPGFPIMLSILMDLGFQSLASYKVINTVFWGIWSLAVFFYARMYISSFLAFIASLFMLTLPFLFIFQQHILTDIPYASLSLCSLLFGCYSIKDVRIKYSILYLVICCVLLVFAIYIRANGVIISVSLLISILLHLYSRERCIKFRNSIYLFTILFVTIVVLIVINKYAQHYYIFYNISSSSYDKDLFHILLDKANSMQNRAYDELGNLDSLLWIGNEYISIGPWLFLVCSFSGFFIKLALRKIDALDIFFTIHLVGILYFPHNGGSRYLFPILPMAVLYFLCFVKESVFFSFSNISFRKAAGYITNILFLLIILSNIDTVWKLRNYNNDEVNRPESIEMNNWIINNSSSDDVILSFKPRATMYLTQRRSSFIDPSQMDVGYIVDQLSTNAAKMAVCIKTSPWDKVALELGGVKNVMVAFENSKYVIYMLRNDSTLSITY